MLQNRVGRTAYTFLKYRSLWLAFLFGVFVGVELMAAWVFIVIRSPDVALGLIEKVT